MHLNSSIKVRHITCIGITCSNMNLGSLPTHEILHNWGNWAVFVWPGGAIYRLSLLPKYSISFDYIILENTHLMVKCTLLCFSPPLSSYGNRRRSTLPSNWWVTCILDSPHEPSRLFFNSSLIKMHSYRYSIFV